jgi:hypothetical protein
MLDRSDFLRRFPFLDATRRVAAGALTVAAPQLSSMTLIPGGILFAAVISLVALRRLPPLPGVWLVILGSAGWAIGSLVRFDGGIALNALGVAFIAVPAIGLALLSEREPIGPRRKFAQA